MTEATKSLSPVLQFLILCDAIAKDQNGKPVLIGVFDQLLRPAVVPQFFISLKWILGLGEHKFKFRILDPELQEIHAFPEGKLKFEKKTDSAQINAQFVNFVFKVPGVHWIEVILNGETYLSVPLPVQSGSTTT